MTRTPAIKTTACLICAALMLAGCGLRGTLKTPPPLWGDDDRPPADAPQAPTDQAPANPETAG